MEDLRALLGDPNDAELESWINAWNWLWKDNGLVYVTNQEEIVKTRNIVDKVNFESKDLIYFLNIMVSVTKKLVNVKFKNGLKVFWNIFNDAYFSQILDFSQLDWL